MQHGGEQAFAGSTFAAQQYRGSARGDAANVLQKVEGNRIGGYPGFQDGGGRGRGLVRRCGCGVMQGSGDSAVYGLRARLRERRVRVGVGAEPFARARFLGADCSSASVNCFADFQSRSRL